MQKAQGVTDVSRVVPSVSSREPQFGQEQASPSQQSSSPTQSPTPTTPAPASTQSPPLVVSNTITYRIKPFKDNDHGIAYRQGFLKSFMDMTKQVQYTIIGNRSGMTMYAIVPTDIALYFENVFYASYPTSELIKDTIELPATKFWVSYGEKDVIVTEREYMKEGKYLDPMRDLFGVYDTVDATDRLMLSFTHTFKTEKTSRQKFMEKVQKVMKFLARVKAEEKPAETKPENPEDAITCKLAIAV